jgi:ABC-type transport system involved in multi-copper enzyme maturation permease subunit
MRDLLRADLVARRKMVFGLAAGVFVFLVVLGGTYQALGGSTMLGDSFASDNTPGFFSAFAGETGVDIFEPASYLALGLIHPLFLVLTFTTGVAMGSASIAADIESGRSELLYTHPRRRSAIIDARLVAWFVAQCFVLVAAFAGAITGSRLSDELRDVSIVAIGRGVAQFAPLAMVVGALAFAASAVSQTRARALSASIGLIALAYLVNFVSLLWHPVAFARRVTPFGYYSPTRALTSIDLSDVVVLSTLAVGLVVVARVVIERRDLV